MAIVLLLAGLAAGLAGAPVAAQDDDQGQDNDQQGQDEQSSSGSGSTCQADFDIADGHGNALSRTLLPDQTIVGRAVVSSGNPEDLFIHLEAGEITVGTVFLLDPQANCLDYKAGTDPCSTTVTDETSHVDLCTLEAPEDRDYFVPYTNTGGGLSTFHTWTEPS